MKIHRSRPDSRYTIIPNELLQNQKLTFTARGILVDILSRPDGWGTTADAMWELARRMRPDVAEGRRIVRAAFAEAKALGYMVEARERQQDGTFATILHVYDTPGHGDRRTGSGMSVVTSDDAQTPSSNRRTGSGMSVATCEDARSPSSDRDTGSGTSIERTKARKNSKKEGLAAHAESIGSDDAHASSGAGKPSRGVTESSATKQPATREDGLKASLMTHLASLGEQTMDRIIRDMELRSARLMRWGRNKACLEYGVPKTTSLYDDLTGRYTCRAVAAVLLRQTQEDGGGLTEAVVDLLGDFRWPDDRPAPRRRSGPAVEARAELPYVTYFEPAPGISDEQVRIGMYKEVNAMPNEAAIAKCAQLRAYRRGDTATYEAKAREHIKNDGQVASRVLVAKVTIMFGIQHFSGKWPMFVDPAEPVDMEAIAAYEQLYEELKTAANAA